LTISGTTSASGHVAITVNVRRDRRTRRIKATVPIRKGRFRVQLRLSPADARGAVEVAARYGGSSTHKPDTDSRRVRRR
jgi:hypothetical protein